MNSEPTEESIFERARGIEVPRDREAYLDEVCGENEQLRRRVELLLDFDRTDGGLVDQLRGEDLDETELSRIESVGGQVGPYKLLDVIGEGGMGTVFMAEQRIPIRRRVALKVIKPGMDSRQVIARFEAERQALSMMDHPNIAKVLDAGTTSYGRPYFVMELINGIPLTEYCDEHHLSLDERLKLFVPICDAIQHAHTKGIIHRDLKPSNILIALYDGRPVAKVIDFGVAKATQQSLTERTLFTRLGQVVGTFEYMSPEQAQRNQLDIDTRTDVYSLGAIFYELLTGTPPFRANELRSAGLDELLRIIREVDPPRPSLRLSTDEGLPSIAANRQLEPRRLSVFVRGDLDWISMKALEKDRSRRYETAEGLRNDVLRFLDHEAIQARPPSSLYRTTKFIRRHRVGVTMAALVAVLVTVGMLGTVSQTLRARESERQSNENSVRAVKAEIEAKRQRDETLKANAQLLTSLSRSESLRLAFESERLRDRFPVRSLLLGIAAVEATQKHDSSILPDVGANLREALSGVGGSVIASGKVPSRAVALFPTKNRCVIGWEDGRVTEAALNTKVLDAPITQHASPILAVAISPDGNWVASYSRDGEMHLCDRATKRVTQFAFAKTFSDWGKLGTADPVAFSPDGRWLACSGAGNEVRLWDLNDAVTSASALVLRSHTAPVVSLTFGPSSRWLITCCGHHVSGGQKPDASARLWDLSAEAPQENGIALQHGDGGVQMAAISHDGRWAATAGWDKIVNVWNLSSANPQHTVKSLEHDVEVHVVSFSPSGTGLATGSGNFVRLWEHRWPKPEARQKFQHDGRVTGVEFSGDGKHLVSIQIDQKARVWNVADNSNPDLLAAHDGPIADLAVLDGLLLTASKDGTVRKWTISPNQRAGSALQNLPGGLRARFCGVTKNLISDDASYLKFSDSVADGRNKVVQLRGRRSAIDPSGRWLAVTNVNERPARVYDLHSGDIEGSVKRLYGKGNPTAVAVGLDGRWIAVADETDVVNIWTIEGDQVGLAATLELDAAARQLVASQTADWLFVRTRNGSHHIWDMRRVTSPRQARFFPEETAKGPAAVFSAADSWFAASDAHGVSLADLRSNGTTDILEIRAESPVFSLAFSQDERRIVMVDFKMRGLTSWELPHTPSMRPRPEGFMAPDGGIVNIHPSADGRWMVTRGHDGTLRRWDLNATDLEASSRPILRKGAEMYHIAVSEDGHWMATGAMQPTGLRTYLWPLNDERLLHLAKLRAGRNLSELERETYLTLD